MSGPARAIAPARAMCTCRGLCCCLVLLALGSCRDGASGEIRFVGLRDGPCGGGPLAADAAPLAADAAPLAADAAPLAADAAPLATDAAPLAADAAPDGAPTVLFGTVPLRVVSTSGKALSAVKIFVGEEAFPLEAGTTVYLLDTTTRPDGDLTLAAEATDSGGGSHSTRIRVCLDNHGPEIELISPAEGTVFRAEDAALTVRLRASDSTGLSQLKARLSAQGTTQERSCSPEGTGVQRCTFGPAQMPLSIEQGLEQEATLEVVARDRAGHESSVSRRLTAGTRLRWSLNVNGRVRWPVEILDGSRLAVATDSGRVLVVDRDQHAVVCEWIKPTETLVKDPSEEILTPLATNEAKTRLFFGSYFNLWAVSVDGCTTQTPAPLYGATDTRFQDARPAVIEGGGKTVLLVALSGNILGNSRLGAIDGLDGVVLDSLELASEPKAIRSSPALSVDKGTVYIGTPEGKLVAVDVRDPAQLAEKWTFSAGSEVAIETRPLPLGDHVHVSTEDGKVRAVRADTGEEDTSRAVTLESAESLATLAASLDGGLLYVASQQSGGALYGLPAKGGAPRQITVGSVSRHAYPAIATQGSRTAVYVATRENPAGDGSGAQTGGRLYALSADLSTIYWVFQREHPFHAAPVVSNETVYIGNDDGYLYALDTRLPEEL